ncbi:MAG TPA: hypothetical protein VFX58_06680 [Chitinophagaceae bacterium]|nr:hypothetical protein [Chitinophagaceae bacterium]
MNQKALYEMTITEKLEQLTVPDMVDAIWSRIETQLDIDLPADEGPAEPPSSPPAGGGSWILPAFIIAVTAFVGTLYFTNRNNPAVSNDKTPIRESPSISDPAGNNNGAAQPGTVILPRPKQPGENTSQGLPLFDSVPAKAGSGVLLPVADSNANTGGGTVISPPLVSDQPDSNKKKSRGVKGITDDDYRVVPAKKDSTR